MKQKILLGIIAIILLLATATSALGVIEDDFDRADTTAGLGVATNGNAWVENCGGVARYEILNNQMFFNQISSSTSCDASLDIEHNPSYISFDSKRTSVGDTWNFYGRGDTGIPIYLKLKTNTNILQYYNGSFNDIATLPVGSWFHIEIKNIDYVSKTYDVWLDNVSILEDAVFSLDDDTIENLHFYNYKFDAYYDNITTLEPVSLDNFSTIETASFAFEIPISIGASYGVVNSITFNNTETNSSPFYWSSVLSTNASAASTANCRIAVDGSTNVENTRSLEANTLGNFMLETIPVNLSLGVHTVVTECKKVGGAKYEVTNSQATQFHLHDDITNTTINYKTINSTTGFSVTSTPTLLASFNFTTSNVTNTTNVNDLVVHGRATYNYDSDGDLTTYLELRETDEVCGNYTRGGSSGSSGSVGTTCLFENLNSSTTYNLDFYGFRDSGTGSVTELLMNVYNLRVNETAATNTVLDKVIPAATNTTVATVNITNPLGGSFNVFTSAGVMVQANTSQDAYFWVEDGTNSINYYRSLPSSGSNGNINTQFVFQDSGTSTKEYKLMAYCPSGCTVSSGDLTAFVTDADSVSTGEFTVTAHNSYNDTSIQEFNVTIGGSTLSTTNGSITLISQDDINVLVEAENFFSNTTFHDTTTNLNASLDKYTEFRANSYLGTPINNFTVNTSSDTYTTTNSIAYLPITTNTSVTFNNAEYAKKTDTVSKVQYYNFTAYTENSVDLFIYDQDTNQLINDTSFSVVFSNNVTADNYTVTDGTLYVDNLLDGNYNVKISGGNYTLVNYVVTVAEDSYQVLNAYLAAVTGTVTFTVRDTNTESILEDATVTMARLINNSWVTVFSKVTDITGTAQLEYVSNVNYRFTITKSGYDTNTFYIDPVIYDSYEVFLGKTVTVSDGFDYLNVLVSFSNRNFYVNQSNNLTMLISSPIGSLETYNFTIVSEAGTQTFSGVSATGESFSYNFNLPASPSNQTVTILYCYDSTLSSVKCYKEVYRVIGSYDAGSFLSHRDNTFGLGLFERIVIATVFVLFVSGLLAAVGGSLAGVGVGLLIFGFFTFTGFIPLWSILPSILVGVVILMGRSD